MNSISYQFLGAFIAIVIPLLFLALMVESRESRRTVLFFCWGVFAGGLAFNLNNHFGAASPQSDRLALSIAPMTEEVLKGLPVLLFLNRKRYPRATRVIVSCAMASGIGFSVQESMYYFAVSARGLGDIAALVIRTFTTALMHGMTTAAFGFGLMLLGRHRDILVPIVFGLFALCATIHALFNLLLQTPFAPVALVMPIGMFLTGWWLLKSSAEER